MKTSRQRLLDYVKSHDAITVAEISQALKMTPANARHHLSILRNSGQIQIIGQHPAEGKGRPANIYGPSDQAMGHNLDKLGSALLDEIRLQPKHLQERSLQRLAEKFARPFPAKSSQTEAKTEHLTKRLYNAVGHLNKSHYQARWEAHRQSPRIILEHCPYHNIIKEHPELCQMDAYLLAHLLSEPVEQIGKLSQDRRGKTYCIFRID